MIEPAPLTLRCDAGTSQTTLHLLGAIYAHLMRGRANIVLRHKSTRSAIFRHCAGERLIDEFRGAAREANGNQEQFRAMLSVRAGSWPREMRVTFARMAREYAIGMLLEAWLGRVVIITDACECIESQLQKRMRLLRASGDARVHLLMPHMLGLARFDLPDVPCCSAIRDALTGLNLGEGDLLILDSMVRFMSGDECDSADIERCFRALRALTPATRRIAHHVRKAAQFDDQHNAFTRIRGSRDVHAATDAVLLLRRDEDAIEARCQSRSAPEIAPFAIRREETIEGHIRCVYSDSARATTAETIFDLLVDAGEAVSRQNLLRLAEERGIGRAACDESIGLLLRGNRIGNDRRGKEVVYYAR